MRRTLGLGISSAGPRRRFAQDGDVPVVVVRGRREENREATEAAAQSEREAHAQAERSLAAAQATIRDLQTKLAHMDMSLTELRHSFERVTGEKQSLGESLEAATSARVEAEAQLEKKVARRQGLDRLVPAPAESAALPMRLPRGRPPRVTSEFSQVTQEPVDWWSKHEKK